MKLGANTACPVRSVDASGGYNELCLERLRKASQRQQFWERKEISPSLELPSPASQNCIQCPLAQRSVSTSSPSMGQPKANLGFFFRLFLQGSWRGNLVGSQGTLQHCCEVEGVQSKMLRNGSHLGWFLFSSVKAFSWFKFQGRPETMCRLWWEVKSQTELPQHWAKLLWGWDKFPGALKGQEETFPWRCKQNLRALAFHSRSYSLRPHTILSERETPSTFAAVNLGARLFSACCVRPYMCPGCEVLWTLSWILVLSPAVAA